jgi:hypothetical protein
MNMEGPTQRIAEQLRLMPDPPEALIRAAKEFFRRRLKLEALVSRLAEDIALRKRAARDPEAVLREAGLDPAPELIVMLRDDRPAMRSELEQRLAAKRLWL